MSQPRSHNKIIYTLTDEAPALATRSLLPIVTAFAATCDVAVETRDISLAGRMLASFAPKLPEDQRVNDDLADLGQLATTPEANIIKLPNISASVPQMTAAADELRQRGYEIPEYPDELKTESDREIRSIYDRVKGSAVNPVLREGNSDRRAPGPVKRFAKNNPHSMGEWSSDSKTRIATMGSDDFASNEQSTTLATDTTLNIEHLATDGTVTTLASDIEVGQGDIVDATFMDVNALKGFLSEQIEAAAAEDILFSLHLKATMMKVSDPIIFGHAVKEYFADVFEKNAALFERAGVHANNGLGALLDEVGELDSEATTAVQADIAARIAQGPALAMVNSDRGITNLHVPSDVIIDASMPAMIRTSGQMWNAAGNPQDTLAVIPDSSYAGIYQVAVDDCKENGAFDPETMGTTPNVGLMAQKAEEYGSHDKTFEIPAPGVVRVVGDDGEVFLEHKVDVGDIWRSCIVTAGAIDDWVRLAVGRAKASNTPAIFWLNRERAHDAQLIARVEQELESLDTAGLELSIAAPTEAMTETLHRARSGLDTISVTGNVLRDYLTDLFPILELGTSAKMLSIVPLMNGGGLFETGAGGSAPKHVQQLVAENHLRWDSLGEFLALNASLNHFAETTANNKAQVLADALERATTDLLENRKSPSRVVHELDNRGSHYYLARYWAVALAEQDEDEDLAEVFAPIARRLVDGEQEIVDELNGVQGSPVNLGGYYVPDEARVVETMRPSSTFNTIIEDLARVGD